MPDAIEFTPADREALAAAIRTCGYGQGEYIRPWSTVGPAGRALNLARADVAIAFLGGKSIDDAVIEAAEARGLAKALAILRPDPELVCNDPYGALTKALAVAADHLEYVTGANHA